MTPGPVVAAADAMARACVYEGDKGRPSYYYSCAVCRKWGREEPPEHMPHCAVALYLAARKEQADD